MERRKTSEEPAYRLFQLTCGRQDGFLENDRRLSSWLHEAGVAHEFLEIDGGHTHDVLRRNLHDFLQRLWKEPS